VNRAALSSVWRVPGLDDYQWSFGVDLATPPVEVPLGAQLPEVQECGEPMRTLDDFAVFDIYASMGLREPRPLRLRDGVVAKLKAADRLLPSRLSLVVLDGWRSMQFQTELLAFYSTMYPNLGDGFVSDPKSQLVPPHTTGGAVDLTLAFDGEPLALGTDFDSFEEQSALSWFESMPGLVRSLRRTLTAAMTEAGFAPYPLEWWHFSHGDQIWAHFAGAARSKYAQVPS